MLPWKDFGFLPHDAPANVAGEVTSEPEADLHRRCRSRQAPTRGGNTHLKCKSYGFPSKNAFFPDLPVPPGGGRQRGRGPLWPFPVV